MPQKPIWEQATGANPALRFFSRRHQVSRALTLTVSGHVLVEFLLNEIIRRHCKDPKPLLDDHRSYSFAIKLQLLHAMNVLPEDLYRNVRKLNNIRNHFAHHLDRPQTAIDFIGYDGGKTVNLRHYCRKTKHPECEYLELLCHVILTDLTKVFMKMFNEPPPVPTEES